MEDIKEESIMDIDGCDADNPREAVEYIEDIYSFYRKIEVSDCDNYFTWNGKLLEVLVGH